MRGEAFQYASAHGEGISVMAVSLINDGVNVAAPKIPFHRYINLDAANAFAADDDKQAANTLLSMNIIQRFITALFQKW